MLPKILDIANEQGLTFNPRTYGKKETTCKCPFCNEDSNKSDKYYLSLNTHDNVYKCWYCGAKGGVLDFESRLTGIPYQQIKEKYFPRKNKQVHGAYKLNNRQLKMIGWDEFKRQSLKGFQEKRDEVYKDWQLYEHKELRKLFALFMIASYVQGSEDRWQQDFNIIVGMAEKSGIYLAYSKLVEQFSLDFEERCTWAKEGTEIARIAWKGSLIDCDFDMEQALLRVLFVNFHYVEKELNSNSKPTNHLHVAEPKHDFN